MHYIFQDYPSILKTEDYNEVLKIVVDSFSKIPYVRQIYQFGNIRAPGVSDIDLLFILPEKLTKDKTYTLKRIYDDLLKDFSFFIGCHHPYFVTESLITDFCRIRPLGNIKLLYGEDIPIKAPEMDEWDFLAMLWDLCICYYPSIFHYSLLKRRINIRYQMQIINAMRFVIEILPKAGISLDGEFREFQADILSLRKSWISLSTGQLEKSILDLLSKSTRLSYRILFILKERLISDGLKWEDLSKDKFLHISGIPKIFKHFDSFEKAFEKSNTFYKKFRIVCSYYPKELAALYFFFIKLGGIYQNNLNDRMVYRRIPCFTLGKGLKQALERRASSQKMIFSFYKENNIPFDMIYNFVWITYPPVTKDIKFSHRLYHFMLKSALKLFG